MRENLFPSRPRSMEQRSGKAGPTARRMMRRRRVGPGRAQARRDARQPRPRLARGGILLGRKRASERGLRAEGGEVVVGNNLTAHAVSLAITGKIIVGVSVAGKGLEAPRGLRAVVAKIDG